MQSHGADSKQFAILHQRFISGIGAAFVRGLMPLIRGRSPLFIGCG
jgi:hypothetical protein